MSSTQLLYRWDLENKYSEARMLFFHQDQYPLVNLPTSGKIKAAGQGVLKQNP